STATGLVAYRVVQEALTNAQKHGNGRATADITCGDQSITILVTNPVGNLNSIAGMPGGTGHGLIGMRERVRMVDGMLQHGEDSGTFTLRAELPLSPRGTDVPTISTGATRND